MKAVDEGKNAVRSNMRMKKTLGMKGSCEDVVRYCGNIPQKEFEIEQHRSNI